MIRRNSFSRSIPRSCNLDTFFSSSNLPSRTSSSIVWACSRAFLMLVPWVGLGEVRLNGGLGLGEIGKDEFLALLLEGRSHLDYTKIIKMMSIMVSCCEVYQRVNASIPVMALPRMRTWMSLVPS
jgi:hypothetical protein